MMTAARTASVNDELPSPPKSWPEVIVAVIACVPCVTGGAVVVLGAIAYLIYFGSPFSSSRAPDIYRETLVIWEEAQRLKESPGEWTPFRDKSLPRVQQLGTELVQEASSKDRLMQLMLYCHRDCLPLILQGPDTAGPKWDEMKDYMEEAKRYMPAE